MEIDYVNGEVLSIETLTKAGEKQANSFIAYYGLDYLRDVLHELNMSDDAIQSITSDPISTEEKKLELVLILLVKDLVILRSKGIHSIPFPILCAKLNTVSFGVADYAVRFARKISDRLADVFTISIALDMSLKNTPYHEGIIQDIVNYN